MSNKLADLLKPAATLRAELVPLKAELATAIENRDLQFAIRDAARAELAIAIENRNRQLAIRSALAAELHDLKHNPKKAAIRLAAEIIAGSAVPALRLSSKADTMTKTRAEFDALTAVDRSAFIRSGGRLTD